MDLSQRKEDISSWAYAMVPALPYIESLCG